MQKLLPLILILVFLAGIGLALKFLPRTSINFAPANQSTKSAGFGVFEEDRQKKDFTKLLTSYNQILSQTKAGFGITYLDLKTGEKISINGEKPFHAASTTKPILAALVLKQVDDGKLTLDQKISEIPLSERLRLMINISDNDSWEILLKFFGIANIQKFSQSLGLSSTSHFENTSTTEDLAKFLTKIYQGEILSSKSSQYLLNLMQNTETEDRIPAGISNKKLVFHKSGTYQGEIHDIGIINHPEDPFILAILSNGENDLGKRPQILAEIAKISWEFVGQ